MKKSAKICILILLILILIIAVSGLFVRFGSSAVPFEGKNWVIEDSKQNSFESVLFLDDCQWSHYALKNGVDSLEDSFTRYKYFPKQKKVLVYEETRQDLFILLSTKAKKAPFFICISSGLIFIS